MTLDSVMAVGLAPLFGSLIAVVDSRFPDWREIAIGRSRCDRCGGAIAMYDLVPVASWAALLGHCRCCGAAIGVRPLAVELAATAIAVWAATVLDGAMLAVACALGWTLLALALVDGRHLVLPDALTLPLLAGGLAVAAADRPDALADSAFGVVAGYAAFAGLAALYRGARGRAGLGDGDATLLAAAGAWVTWTGLASVVLIASVAGLVAAVVQARLHGRTLRGDARLPFGPFLALGLWLTWLHGPLTFAL